MKQIFERIKRIIKSNLNEYTSINEFEYVDLDESEDLKRQIDEAFQKKSNIKIDEDDALKNLTLSDAYKILEVEPNASIEEIRKAYKAKVKQYHPDLVQNLGREIQELANRKLLEINYAFNLILKQREM
jgi:DnaJ-class molecular chaperone with C-terminal Zn finger domain